MQSNVAAFATGTWPWYIAGPVIGLFVPALLLIGNRMFGVSSNLRHLCSALLPGGLEHFRYDWKRTGLWNLLFVAGTGLGGFLASHWGASHDIQISEQTRLALTNLGIHDFSGLAPREVFTWSALLTLKGFVSVVVGGFWSASARPMPEGALPVMRSRAWRTSSYRRWSLYWASSPAV